MPDPEKPKRPTTPWLRFLKEFRQTTTVKGKEVMSAGAKEWKAMPDAQKRRFEEPYEAECRVYEKALKEYVDSGKKAAWERPPDKPKKPVTAYMLYAQEYREKHPHLKVTEASQIASELWKDMQPAEKVQYEQQYQINLAKYKDDIKAYNESGKEEEWKIKVGITAKQDKEKAKEGIG